jgi:hypothetical protein
MSEAATVATLHARYAEEQERDRHDALRLVELRDLVVERDLTTAERAERRDLEDARADREPRLKRLQREAVTAQDDVNIVEKVARRDVHIAQKEAAYDVVQELTRLLHHAWREVFRIHRLEENDFNSLPRAGSSYTTFPSDTELADQIAGRMPAEYGGMVRDACRKVLPIHWAAVRDVDVGLKRVEDTWIGRVQEVARAYRLKMTQQAENATCAAAEEPC